MTLPPERSGHAAPEDLVARRASLAAAVAAGYWRTEPAPENIDIGGIRCLRFVPSAASTGTVVHMHGGAFRIGCPEMIAPFAAALAAHCQLTVICPAYRLAPEHPFPAGLRDGLSVLTAVAGTRKQGVVLIGDSAGGGLAASLALLAGDAHIPLAGLVLLSPWLDLTVSTASYTSNALLDPLFSAAMAGEASAQYLQGASALAPLASPLLGKLASFPPTFINVGAGEVLLDDARRMHEALCSAGVAVQLDVVDGMDHVAVTRDMGLPGAAQTFATLATFINARMKAH